MSSRDRALYVTITIPHVPVIVPGDYHQHDEHTYVQATRQALIDVATSEEMWYITADVRETDEDDQPVVYHAAREIKIVGLELGLIEHDVPS